MLLWADGFEHWGNDANFQTQYLVNDSVSLSTDNLRTGAKSLLVSNNRAFCRRSIPARTSFIMGMAVYQSQITPVANNPFQFAFFDANGDNIFTVRLEGTQQIQVWNLGYNNMLGASAANVVPINAYNYIEIKAVILAGANSSITVRVNNQIVLSIINATLTRSNPCTVIGWGGNFTNVNALAIPSWLSDFYIADLTAPNNDFFGDVRCRTIYPALNGADQDWTPNGSANAWECLNKRPPQPGVFKITAATVNNKSSFGLNPVPTNTSQINGIMLFQNLSKSDAGACEITPGVDSNGSVATITPVAPSTAATFYNGAIQLDPNGGGNWTFSKVNALLATVKRTV